MIEIRSWSQMLKWISSHISLALSTSSCPIHDHSQTPAECIRVSSLLSCLHGYHELFSLPRKASVMIATYTRRLIVIIARPRHDNIIHLEHHPAQLRRQHELLLLADERINHKGLFHVVGAVAHAVNTEAAAASGIFDLLALHLGQCRDRVQTAVLGEGHGDGVERLGKCPHRVLLQAGRLDSRILNRQAAGNLGRTAAIDDAVVAHKVAHDAKGVVERALGLVDDLGSS